MNDQPNPISLLITSHPKESTQMALILCGMLWFSPAALIGIVIYLVIKQWFHLPWWTVLSTGLMVFVTAVLIEENGSISIDTFCDFIKVGFYLNKALWLHVISGGHPHAISMRFYRFFEEGLNYTLGCPLLMAGMLEMGNLIPPIAHYSNMTAIRKGLHIEALPEISDSALNRQLKKWNEEGNNSDRHHHRYSCHPSANGQGTLLGISKYSGQPLFIPDKDINQVMLVLGTTGAGKTVTLKRFYHRAITQGYPLIIVDGKPDESNIAWIEALCQKHDRRFIGFNCANRLPYDPLADGGYTELKDKIISLKDEWSSDYYRSIAEDYLQTTLEVLIKSQRPFDLKAVVNCLNYGELALLTREINDPVLMKRVAGLESYDKKDITGLQAHLNILIHSELGEFFEKKESTFTLGQAIREKSVVYFALPALRFPSFSKVLGKLVVNDLKAVIDAKSNPTEYLFTVFDEFSVFAGEQVLNLVNMGRGKGIHAIFGTQGLADLDKVDVTFKNQVLNCVNTLICHRLNDDESATTVASWVGTQYGFSVTAQINMKEHDAAMGSVKSNKAFIVHPDDIKQGLQTGEAFYITKIGRFRRDKVRVIFS